MSVLDIFAALRSGGAIVVVDEAQRRDPDAWARLIDTYEVTAGPVGPAGPADCWPG
ncbi:AMP-binding enzyme family protein [Mycobacterium tuberculosis variant bovis]|nr:AMP-binding enzyme family protein [Mycobacterium tuberculosis variant bovis]